MNPNERPTTTAIRCAEAEGLTREYTAGTIEKGRLRQLRSHMAKCTTCMQAYRDAVETKAALARFTVEQHEEKLVERQRSRLHATVFGTRKEKGWRFPFRLRLVIVPAVIIYIMTQVTNLGAPPARVELVGTEGQVLLSKKPVNPEVDRLLILPGRWLTTAAFGKATIDAGACLVQLGAETQVMLESARPVRFRLSAGYVSVDGDAIFVTVLGLVSVTQGKGSLQLSNVGLHLDPQSGQWKIFDQQGERVIPLGDPILIQP